VGVAARAAAAAEAPVVLLEMVAGKSAGVRARKVGVDAGPEPGPAKTLLAVCVRSCGVSIPLDVVGEPGTAGLKMMPSPAIPTLVTVPELTGPFATKRVRTSVTAEIAVLVVTTVAIGMVAEVKPVAFDAGAQLFVVSRYT
jgi:hypothetical protein